MPLQGTFDVLDFTEVLRLIAGQHLTGRLHVRSRNFGANLFTEDGELVGADQSEHQPAATAGDVRGRIEEICFEMLGAERGNFEFHPGKPSTIPVAERHKVDAVLSRARKRLDEWHELQEAIPSLELQPRLVLALGRPEVTFDQERWRMLTAIDGRRNLRAIGRVLNLSDFDVCRVVRALIDDSVVELDGLAALSASTRDAMPVVPAPDASGLERIVTEPSGERPELPTVPALPSPGPLVVTTGPKPDVEAEPAATDEETGTPEPEDAAPADPEPAEPGDTAPAGDAESEEGSGGSKRGRRVIRIRTRHAEQAG